MMKYVCSLFYCVVNTLFQNHTDNFGHPAIHELLHVFLYSRDNQLGNLRQEEFGRRVPNGMLALATTTVSLCI